MDTICLKDSRPMKAEDISNLEQARIWAVEHDANVNAWWDHQWKENAKSDIKMVAIEKEVRKIGQKVIYWNGAMNVITSFLGAALAIALAFWKMNS